MVDKTLGCDTSFCKPSTLFTLLGESKHSAKIEKISILLFDSISSTYDKSMIQAPSYIWRQIPTTTDQIIMSICQIFIYTYHVISY